MKLEEWKQKGFKYFWIKKQMEPLRSHLSKVWILQTTYYTINWGDCDTLRGEGGRGDAMNKKITVYSINYPDKSK